MVSGCPLLHRQRHHNTITIKLVDTIGQDPSIHVSLSVAELYSASPRDHLHHRLRRSSASRPSLRSRHIAHNSTQGVQQLCLIPGLQDHQVNVDLKKHPKLVTLHCLSQPHQPTFSLCCNSFRILS